MSAKVHEPSASASVRTPWVLIGRTSPGKKRDPADLQQVLLLVAELNRVRAAE